MVKHFVALSLRRHTLGHICFYATEGDQKAVFTGDTLFVGGAGKFFEGTPEQMQRSLGEKLGKLPAETLVYCGHEVSRLVWNMFSSR